MPDPDAPPPSARSPDKRAPAALPVSQGPFSGPVFSGWAQELPLFGVTILAVEDSRFACEALRLMARRAGARLRRADRLETARAHLRVYRPDVVLVDLGLPDGRGEGLIRDLVLSPRRPTAVIGMSGSPEGRQIALAAGADGFLEKPVQGLARFCRVLRPLLPDLDIEIPTGSAAVPPPPDQLAMQDDLAYAARVLQGHPGPEERRYLGGFLAGLAELSADADLAAAAKALAAEKGADLARRLIAARLNPGAAFGPRDGPPS